MEAPNGDDVFWCSDHANLVVNGRVVNPPGFAAAA